MTTWGPQTGPWLFGTRYQHHQRELKGTGCPHKAGCKDPKEFHGFIAGDSAPKLTSTEAPQAKMGLNNTGRPSWWMMQDGPEVVLGHSTQTRCSWPTQNCKVSVCPHPCSLELYSTGTCQDVPLVPSWEMKKSPKIPERSWNQSITQE